MINLKDRTGRENRKFYDLSKSFKFETAHRLSKGYVGKCSNIHGHSWVGRLIVRAYGLDQYGMGVDYTKLKEMVLNDIEAIFDHKLVLYVNDPMLETLRNTETEIVTMENNPTSEVIGRFIFDYARIRLYKTDNVGNTLYEVIAVEIDETCTSSCRITEK